MAVKIGDLFFEVRADVTQALKSVSGLTDSFKDAGGVAARAIGETVARATAIAVTGTIALTAATLNAGTAYNVLGQSATAAFTTIYDSAEAASGLLKEISELNLETPFRGSAIARTSRTLAGFGVELENNVRLTEALAEATAAMGLGSDALNRIAIAFGQIQSRGKLAGDEARQLANYGIDAYGLLADKLGLTVAAVRELGQASKLTADFVIPSLVEAIEERFGGATERLFNTAAGQAEGLRSVMEAVGSALVEPFIGFAGGGAVVDAMQAVRLELVELVSVAEDGSFVLRGFLEPLGPIAASLADNFRTAAMALADGIDSIDDTALLDLMVQLQGLGPLLAGAGAALSVVFAQGIPVLGRLFAGLNPIVVGVTALILASRRLRETFSGAFREISDDVAPLVPQVRELLRNLVDLAEDAGPAIASILVTAVDALAPVLSEALSAANDLIPVLNPVLVKALEAVALVLKLVAGILDAIGPELILVTGVVYGLATAFPVLTASIIFATTNMGLLATQTGVATTAFGAMATVVGIALAAIGSYQAISAGLTGDIDYLNRDVPFYEKPFQLAGRFGYALGGGDRQQAGEIAAMERGREIAASFNLTLLDSAESFGEARAMALQWSGALGVSAQAADDFANTVALAWQEHKAILEEQEREQMKAAHNYASAYRMQAQAYLEFLNERAGQVDPRLFDEEIDLVNELTSAANEAWTAVDRLLRADAGATLDDFLRGLPAIAEELTDALNQGDGLFQGLDVTGALDNVRQEATKVIQTLARDYGLSLDEIRALFDERGLQGVIEALGTITEETSQTVDPLIAKYASLGATADQLRDAIAKLNDERQTAIKAEIDQVSAALRDAEDAAQDARDAIKDFLSGGYLDSPQALVDSLIGDIGNIGSTIEDALKQGGVQGDAAIRQALGGVQEQIAQVVEAGLASGMSGAQIVSALQPVFAAINEQVGESGLRFITEDWTQGITANAGGRIASMLSGVLDPNQIQALLNRIIGADARVEGLQARLGQLRSELSVEVEFSNAQVQSALDEIQVTMTPVVTPEAAQAIYTEIQDLLDNEELAAAIDKSLIVQDILDAAKEAEDSLSLEFNATAEFDREALRIAALSLGTEFAEAFNSSLIQIAQERWLQQNAGGPTTADAIERAMQRIASDPLGALVQIDAPITIQDSGDPRATASETVSALGAAAGSGGRLSLSTKVFIPRGAI